MITLNFQIEKNNENINLAKTLDEASQDIEAKNAVIINLETEFNDFREIVKKNDKQNEQLVKEL